jgi:hypothetical protein
MCLKKGKAIEVTVNSKEENTFVRISSKNSASVLPSSEEHSSNHTDKKKIILSSNIGQFRVEQLQSHM